MRSPRARACVRLQAASLHAALARSGERALCGLGGCEVVEVKIRDADGWAMHDFPLYIDQLAWSEMIDAERAALGLESKTRRGWL